MYIEMHDLLDERYKIFQKFYFLHGGGVQEGMSLKISMSSKIVTYLCLKVIT